MTSLRFLPEQIEHWPLARLKPYERNPRLHSDDQVAKVAASIASYGWTVPLLVTEDGEVIAGHGRLLAARQPTDGTLHAERRLDGGTAADLGLTVHSEPGNYGSTAS